MRYIRANGDIRHAIVRSGFPQWMVAEEFGRSESDFSRMLRRELTDSVKHKIMAALERVVQREGGLRDGVGC